MRRAGEPHDEDRARPSCALRFICPAISSCNGSTPKAYQMNDAGGRRRRREIGEYPPRLPPHVPAARRKVSERAASSSGMADALPSEHQAIMGMPPRRLRRLCAPPTEFLGSVLFS
jgi:hypothetical protein